jgi:transposase
MRKSRLSKEKQERLIEHFISGSTARTAASLVNVNKTTAAYYFHRLREIIAQEIQNGVLLSGEFEVDESYFGGHRKGKRGCGAAGKVPVFGILKRGGMVYTQIIPDAKSKTLIPIIRDKIQPYSIVYSDCWRARVFWMFQSSNTTGSTIQNCLQTSIIISTGLRTSGTRPSATCGNLTVFLLRILGYF